MDAQQKTRVRNTVKLFQQLELLTEDMSQFAMMFILGPRVLDAVIAVKFGCKTDLEIFQAKGEHFRVGDTAIVDYSAEDAIDLVEDFTPSQKAAVRARLGA